MKIFVIMGSVILLNSLANIFFKYCALNLKGNIDWGLALFFMGFGLFCMGAGFLFWRKALAVRRISFLYPWLALVYVLTPLFCAWFFEEAFSSTYWTGIFLIIAGISISGLAVKESD